MVMASSIVHSQMLALLLYLVSLACVSCININSQNIGTRRECGSFAAVAHLSSSSLGDRIRDNSSPLNDNGGVAALHNSAIDFGSSTHKCGATLISNRHLLTAAHCMVSSDRLIGISLGREDLDKNPFRGPQTYEIQEVNIHPDYGSATHDYNDIAIITTNREVQYEKKIWPFCLPDSNQVFADFLPVQIAGWGQVNQSHTASFIQRAFVKIIENTRCESLWQQHAPDNYDLIRQFSYPQGLNSKILCAGREGVDACGGDSGGPMSYQDSDGSHIVIGLIAKGLNCPLFPITPGFYTSIASAIDWIYTTTKLPRPLESGTFPLPWATSQPATTFSPGKPVFGFNGSPDGGSGGNCKSFYYSTEKTTWEDARRRCALRGGDLAVPPSSDGSCILDYIDHDSNRDKWNQAYWVGASGISFRGKAAYTWHTGRSMNGPWLSGEPDTLTSSSSGDVCVWVYNLPVSDYKGFGDDPCSSHELYICTQ